MKYHKYKTLDCDVCEWYKVENREELCIWGVIDKVLVPRDNPRRCEVKNRKRREFPKSNVIVELQEPTDKLPPSILEERLNQIKKGYKKNELD